MTRKDQSVNTSREMTTVEKAWALFNKLNELQDLLWNTYWREFLDSENDEKHLPHLPENQPPF